MKQYISVLLILFVLAFYSCNKKEAIFKTFTGDLPIVSTITPKSALVGQDIISKVHFELTSISGGVIFQGFDIKEIATRQFNLNAKALYKGWNTQFSSDMIITFDTTVSLKATMPGQYILNFYNWTQLVKSDSVQVN